MALTGTHIVCCFAGASGMRGSVMSLYGRALWSETMASAGKCTNVVPKGNQEEGDPIIVVRNNTADIYLSIGQPANAAISPRFFIPMNTEENFFSKPGDEVAWALA